MTIPNELHDELWDYCRVNNITNVEEFKLKLLKKGFTVEKFGATPQVIEKIVEKSETGVKHKKERFIFADLSDQENNQQNLQWSVQRAISKINYRIHTDAIKENLIPICKKKQICRRTTVSYFYKNLNSILYLN